MLKPDTLKVLTQDVISISLNTGSKILEIYSSDYSVDQKSDETPLTTADIVANQYIISELTHLTPDIPILTEESFDIPFNQRSQWTNYWLVDPLDGTREFIKQNGEFSVNISLIHNGRPILGVVHAPALDISYFASHNNGAWKMTGNTPPEKIHVRKAPSINDKKFTVTCGRNYSCDRLKKFLSNLGDYKSLPMGSSLKSCLVAEGLADIYPKMGLTSEWDTAAAQCIVKEAGGFVTDINMEELRYNTKESLLNPDFLVFGDSRPNWAAML